MAYKYGTTTKCKVANGQTRDEYECRLGYQVNSQSVSNNTSKVTLILQVRSIKSNYATYGHKQTTKIDGTSLSAKSFDMRDTNTWQTFGKRTITVTHKSDGSYSASKSGSFTTTASSGYSLKSGSASVTVKPATIPRASVPSLSNSNFSVGDTITIYTNRKSSSFTHTIEITCGSYSKTISSVGANTTWNTTDLYQYITTANSQTGTIKVTTYSGSTNVGSKSISFTANIKNSNPILNSYNAYDSNTITTALTGSNQKIIKGYSNITVDNLLHTLKNYATFSKYEMSVGSKTTSTTGTSMTINNVDTNVVNVSVRDSRNNIGSLATTIGSTEGLIEYSPIKINSIEVKRLNSHQGSDDPTGTATSLSFQGTFWNKNFGLKLNSIKSIKYYYKKITDNEYIEGDNTNILSNLTISEDSFSISNLDIKGDIEADTEDEEGNITYYGFDINNAYVIKIEMSDELSVYSALTELPVGKPYIEVGEEYFDFKVPILQNGEKVFQEDSKWKDGNMWSDFKFYNNDTANRPKFRKIGKTVEIQGAVTPSYNFDANTTYTIFNLPEGYRPSYYVSKICQGTGTNIWLLAIQVTGEVTLSRYRNTSSYGAPNAGNWLPFHARFFTD